MPRQTRISVKTANQMIHSMRGASAAVMAAMTAATTDTGCHRPIDWLDDREFERLRQATIAFAQALEISRQARANIQQSR